MHMRVGLYMGVGGRAVCGIRGQHQVARQGDDREACRHRPPAPRPRQGSLSLPECVRACARARL